MSEDIKAEGSKGYVEMCEKQLCANAPETWSRRDVIVMARFHSRGRDCDSRCNLWSIPACSVVLGVGCVLRQC